jgi:hypothetical protein
MKGIIGIGVLRNLNGFFIKDIFLVKPYKSFE